MKYFYLLLSFVSLPLFGQQGNDECVDAIPLPEQMSYCSANAEFSNVGATTSLPVNDYPVCLDERDQIQDVWFSFTALENSVNIQVTGNVDGTPGGTLIAPQFALLSGDCGNLESVGCRSPFESPPNSGQFLNGGNIIFNELVVGQTYFILVTARNGNSGTFELCVDQFDAVPEPSSDCGTGVILCDKSSFSVDFLQGTGQVIDDIMSNNISCGVPPNEFNSAWYKWTCDQSGSLNFTITPLGAAFNEDIDFVVFELGSGLDNCNDKTVLRQMFSGETNGNGAGNIPCLGETGLSDGAGDTSENCGCDPGDNNFLESINMVAGRSYAVVIMNFSGSGDGFSIEFGGSGTFVGPQADFATLGTNQVCVGEEIVFEDVSTSLDAIVSWEWDFGSTAIPRTAAGPGPHAVVFGAPGQPEVGLTITTSRACREILNQQEVNVICCDGQFTGMATATDVVCPADSNGAINFTGVSNFSPTTLTYAWNNGETTEDLTNLMQGQYTVTVTDESGCEDAFDFNVGGPPPFTFDTLITMPDCAGGTNGALTFTVTGGGEGPYVYNFNNAGFGPGNALANLPVSVINVVAMDVNGCEVEQDIFVDELQLGLQPGVPTFTEPVCFGDANGSVTVAVANGRPSYQYDFGLGGGFQNNSTQTGLTAGTYNVTAVDADGCTGEFDITVTEPLVIQLASQSNDISCFGAGDGSLIILAGGGRPGYTYSWNDGSTTDTVRTDLQAGIYTLSLTDQNGCVRSVRDTIVEPNEIFPVLEASNDLTCFEEPTGSFLLSATGGTPDYTYSSDGETFQQGPLLENLFAGNYLLYVQDANGCLDSLSGMLDQPVEFIVDPGADLSVTLGFDTILRAVSNYSPVTFEWAPDSLQCLDPLCTRVRAAPVATTLYTVIGTNDAGCKDTAMVELKVIQDRPLFIPNAISPNGDGTNDGFTVFGGPAVEQVDVLRVYDRWGGLVFENNNFLPNQPNLGWDGKVDGKPVNSAVFVYYTAVRYINGSVLEFKGDVTVVR